MALGKQEIQNRFGYHAGTKHTIPKHEQVREGAIAFATYLDEIVPDGRAKSLMFTALQEATMWANFGIAEKAPLASSPTVPDNRVVMEVSNARRAVS